MKRHVLDDDLRLLNLVVVLTEGFIKKFLRGKLDLREGFDKLKNEFQRLDEIASKKYKDDDLVKYGVRMKFSIIPQLELLEKNVHLYERSKDLCYAKNAISGIAFLTAELSLCYIIQEVVEEPVYT